MKAIGKYIVINPIEKASSTTKGGLLLGEKDREDIRYREAEVVMPGELVEVIKTGDKITGGSFVIDMTSIISTDIDDPKANKGLVDHLKDEDFFDVKKHPVAKLVITDIEYHDSTHAQIKADLSIKGISLPVKFQAEMNYEKSQMTTKFKIDRARWGITYNSKLRDSAISDAIGFEVRLSL